MIEGVLVEVWREKWNRLWGSEGGGIFDWEGIGDKLISKYKSAIKGPYQLDTVLTQI